MRLFAHRGFVTELHPENSVASLKAAVANAFKAIEFDLWFVAGELLIKHDAPKKNELTLLPHLSDYFIYKNDLTYWLDFKNLDDDNANSALLALQNEIENCDIKIEQIYFAPFITDEKKAERIFTKIRNIFGQKVNVVAVCESLENETDLQKLRDFLDRNSVKNLSISHNLLSKNSLKVLTGIEIFAWTVNELPRLKELEALGVKNFATDKITPQIYDGKNSSWTS